MKIIAIYKKFLANYYAFPILFLIWDTFILKLRARIVASCERMIMKLCREYVPTSLIKGRHL